MQKWMFLLHGFNVDDGGATTLDRLRPYAEQAGFRVVELDYGDTGQRQVAASNEPMGRVIAALMTALLDPDDYVVVAAHSNGNAVAARALEHGASLVVDHLLAVNPALQDDWVFPEGMRAVDIFGTPGDFWTSLSRFSIVEEWGDMSNGYEGAQSFVKYHDMSEDVTCPINDHSEVFEEGNHEHWCPKMMRVVNHRMMQTCSV